MTWTGIARTSYFKVRDADAFSEAIRGLGECVGLVHDRSTMDRGYMLYSTDPLGWVYPGNIADLLAAHLADGHVAILIETGFNRRSYGTGRAVAVNGKGETRVVDLADIYALARELGEHVTAAEF